MNTIFANQFLSRLASSVAFLSVLLLNVEPARACSVCFSATDEARVAYYLTTALMMVVPLLLLAAIGFWLYRSFAKQRAELHEQELAAAGVVPAQTTLLQEKP